MLIDLRETSVLLEQQIKAKQNTLGPLTWYQIVYMYGQLNYTTWV